jgi:hypothetical protein
LTFWNLLLNNLEPERAGLQSQNLEGLNITVLYMEGLDYPSTWKGLTIPLPGWVRLSRNLEELNYSHYLEGKDYSTTRKSGTIPLPGRLDYSSIRQGGTIALPGRFEYPQFGRVGLTCYL